LRGKVRKKLRMLILALATLLLVPYMVDVSVAAEEYDCGACIKDHHSLCEESCIDHPQAEKFDCLHDCQQVSCASICSPTPEETPALNSEIPECEKESEDCATPDKNTSNDSN